MEKEKINFYRTQLNLLGIKESCYESYIVANTEVWFAEDMVYKWSRNIHNYVEIREEELIALIKKHVDMLGQADDS